jgi:hypothetical protein
VTYSQGWNLQLKHFREGSHSFSFDLALSLRGGYGWVEYTRCRYNSHLHWGLLSFLFPYNYLTCLTVHRTVYHSYSQSRTRSHSLHHLPYLTMSFSDDPHLHTLVKSHCDQTTTNPVNPNHSSLHKTSESKRSPSPTLQSDLPIRRRPELGQSRTSPYPTSQVQDIQPALAPGKSKITRPRPGLNRTLSFCPSSASSSETYASASRPATPSPSPPGPGRLSKPLERLADGQVMAPSMERSMSSLGIDGWHYSHSASSSSINVGKGETEDEIMDGYPDEDTIQVSDTGLESIMCSIDEQQMKRNHNHTLQPRMPIPTIVVDSPGKTSRPARMSPGPLPPLSSTPTPGFERPAPSYSYPYCDTDSNWTPGLYTPDTPGPISAPARSSYLVEQSEKSEVWGEDQD